MRFLDCLEVALETLCGREVAAWQRDKTMKLMMTTITALDVNCVASGGSTVDKP